MKVAIVVRSYHRQGGIAKGTAEVAECLVERGHEVHIVTNSWKDVRNNQVIFHKVPMIRAAFLERMKQFGWAKVIKGLSFAVMSRFCCDKNDYDVVQVKGDKVDMGLCHQPDALSLTDDESFAAIVGHVGFFYQFHRYNHHL